MEYYGMIWYNMIKCLVFETCLQVCLPSLRRFAPESQSWNGNPTADALQRAFRTEAREVMAESYMEG